MSFCRFSSMDFQCDVYCYPDVTGGYTTHLAARRRVFTEPLPAAVSPADVDALLARHLAVLELVDKAEFEPIALAHAGQTFNDETAMELKTRLAELRALGYRFPDLVLAVVEELIEIERLEAQAEVAPDATASSAGTLPRAANFPSPI